MNKNIVIIGATGLIGKQLVKDLLNNGYNPVVLSRNPSKANELFNNQVEVKLWRNYDIDGLASIIHDSLGVVNLAGESIAARWTKEKKVEILNSRVDSAKTIASAIRKCNNPPEVFIQSSAIGYYSHNSRIQTDEDGYPGDGFLSKVVVQWEQAAKDVQGKTRLVIIRTGVVLSNEGGFLDKILLTIKCFVGGWFGNGNQLLTWIHIKDHIRAIQFLIDNKPCNGIYNIVSPESIPYKQFIKQVGSILHKPVWVPIPTFLLKLIFGEMANEVIFSNQNVVPKRLIQAGFEFQFNDVNSALEDLLNRKS